MGKSVSRDNDSGHRGKIHVELWPESGGVLCSFQNGRQGLGRNAHTLPLRRTIHLAWLCHTSPTSMGRLGPEGLHFHPAEELDTEPDFRRLSPTQETKQRRLLSMLPLHQIIRRPEARS
jgi:hypothetical protein